MPAFGGGLLRLDRYAYLGNSASEIVKTMIMNPTLVIENILTTQKLTYVFWIFAPVAFLPFFAPHTLILLIPGLLENLLTKYEFQFLSLYQYDAVLVAGIFMGAIYGLKNVLEHWPDHQKTIQISFCVAVILGFVMRSPLNPLSFPTELSKTNPHWETLRQMTNVVPPNASVAAHTNLVPHLAERKHIYMDLKTLKNFKHMLTATPFPATTKSNPSKTGILYLQKKSASISALVVLY